MPSVASGIRKTAWGATLVLNLMRAVAAGIAWMIVGLSISLAESNGTPWTNEILLFPLLFPLFYLIFLLPLGLVSVGLNRMGVPWVGLFSVFASLTMVIGDPVLWTINKLLPGGLPVVRSIHFRFVNFVLVLLALKAADAGLCRSCGREVSTMADNCPHCGEPDPWERAAPTGALSKVKATS